MVDDFGTVYASGVDDLLGVGSEQIAPAPASGVCTCGSRESASVASESLQALTLRV